MHPKEIQTIRPSVFFLACRRVLNYSSVRKNFNFCINEKPIDLPRKQDCIPVGCVPPARRPYLTGPGGVGGTWSGGCTWSWGLYLVPGGVPGHSGCTWSGGVYLVRGGVLVQGVYLVPGEAPGPGGYLVRYSPPVNRMTNRCKILPCPKLRLRAVIISELHVRCTKNMWWSILMYCQWVYTALKAFQNPRTLY